MSRVPEIVPITDLRKDSSAKDCVLWPMTASSLKVVG